MNRDLLMDGDDLRRLRLGLGLGLADDATFDALYPPSIRARSSLFWTPVVVASRAARLLAHHDVHRVLDVGSGPGKFCLVGASACSEMDFTGVEHRPHLVETALVGRAQLQLRNVHFLAGDVTDVSWTDFDGFYLYNPFAENAGDEATHFDDTVELSTQRFLANLRCVGAALAAAAVGTCMVTYHGFGGPIPISYELVHAERAHSDWLRVWVKRRRHGDGQTFYVEDGDDLFSASTASGQLRIEKIASAETITDTAH
jgi:SAM-dependent methyltransferase